MVKNIIGTWGFIIAGIIFLIAAIIPFLAGRTINPAFFVISVALLVVGAAIARKTRVNAPPKR
jgi:hypothetical protein